MEATTNDSPRQACEWMYVKWESPEAELDGVARLLETFTFREIDDANDLAIAVPNMMWAVSARQACEKAGIAASIRASHVHLSANTRSRLALLNVISHPSDPEMLAQWQASGHTSEELNALLERYGSARAQALIRLTDLRSCPELSHALLHVCGDESASELFDIVCEQLEHPTQPEGLHVVSIVPYTHLQGSYSQVFMVGCVEGLIPGADTEGESEAAHTARKQAEEAFLGAASHATKRLYFSGFAKADAQFARANHIAFTRTKREGDREVALCRISPLFGLFGSARPSTLGGQVLLRTYKLN